MKKRWVKIIAIGCAGAFLATSNTMSVGAASSNNVNAGVFDALSSYMVAGSTAGTSVNSVNTTSAANGTQTMTEQQTQAATEQQTQQQTQTADKVVQQASTATTQQITSVVSGYTNLGIADVDTTLNVRSQADENSDAVGKMPKNSACEILENDGAWYKIKSGSVTGYVKSEYLLTGDAANKLAQQIVSTVATVTTQTLYVREQPNSNCTILALMPEGEELQVTETDGDWYKVDLDGDAGYVNKAFVSVSQELPKAMTMTEIKYGQGVSDVRVDLVNYAEQFVGNSYVWGGTSLTHGADCSGFVLSVYAKYGISLPHHAASQAGHGTKINSSEARPGDLFFYGSGKSISHVGIYIGNGQIVHASSPKTGIKISNAFYRSPICVVRLLN